MRHYISDVIGDGIDGDEKRPATTLITPGFSGCYENADSSGKVLVKCENLSSDPRWTDISLVDHEAMGVPVDDLTTEDEIVDRTARRFLLRQMLGDDDLPGLSGTFGNIPEAQRIRMQLKLAGVDMSSIRGNHSLREATKIILPQIRMPRAFGSKNTPAPSGTFTDDFTDTNGTNLDDHTPSGGTAWSVQTGSSSDLSITSNRAVSSGSTSNNQWWCDDQGSADCYVSLTTYHNNSFGAQGLLRGEKTSPNGSYTYIRVRASTLSIVKIDTSLTVSLLQAGTATISDGTDIKLEADGTSLEAFYDTGSGWVSDASTTDSQNLTETRQGIGPRSGFTIDDYEAGVLAAAADLLPLIGPGGLIGPSMLIGDRSGLIG